MKLHIPLSDGSTLTFEGEYEELVSTAERFLEKSGNLVAVGTTSAAAPNPQPANQAGSRRWNEQKARRLWGQLYGDQAKIVRFLVTQGGRAEYKELGKHMGYDAQSLSGVLSAITRNAQTATGDRLARLVDWRNSEAGKREYYIDATALPFFTQLVNQPV